jgi:SSS family solute:Na+ symporter
MIFTPGQYQVHDGRGGFIDAYNQLPGIMMFIIGGQWVNNLNYFGCNQYMTQRALGADINTARNGVLFAAFLKMMMPFIVVLPGLAAYVLFQENADTSIVNGITQNGIVKPDNAYPVLLNLLPVGLKGLAFAALTAAIVASLAGKANSISTIYMLDIHKKFFNKNLTEKQTVWTGRLAIIVAFIIALIVSPLLANFGQAFEYIQVYTGYISPGILSIFLLGFFWKKANALSALVAGIGSVALSILAKFVLPAEFPFMDRIAIVFILCALLAVVVTYMSGGKVQEKAIDLNGIHFKTEPVFNVACLGVVLVLIAFYTVWW